MENNISIIHKTKCIYAYIYKLGNKLSKRDKLGIHAYIEKLILQTLSNLIRSALSQKNSKIQILEEIRVSLEVVKQLARTEHELEIINRKTYWFIERQLVEISKMTNGWIKYFTKNKS